MIKFNPSKGVNTCDVPTDIGQNTCSLGVVLFNGFGEEFWRQKTVVGQDVDLVSWTHQNVVLRYSQLLITGDLHVPQIIYNETKETHPIDNFEPLKMRTYPHILPNPSAISYNLNT